jgi:hypothetical protein
MRDLASNLGIVTAIVPAVQSATATSAAIDLLGFGSAAVVVHTGAIASAGDFGAKVQESDTTTSGDFTDVAAGDLVGTFPATALADSVTKVSYIGHKRYIRVVLTKAGGTSIAAGALVIKGHAETRPVA